MGKLMTRVPKIFHVNWFKTDEKGDFLWPGFGENLRVLEWIMDRCRRTAGAKQTPIGFIPRSENIDLAGLEYQNEQLEKVLAIDPKDWQEEALDIEKFFSTFGKDLPKELSAELKALQERLAK